MSLFDFALDIGKKLFNSENDAPAALQKLIEEDNPGIENVQIKVNDGCAVLSGVAKSAEALEKAVLMAGNVLGIENIDVSGVTIADGGAIGDESEFYTIKKGDTLWKIAENVYGNGAKYESIFQANREVVKDPDKIYPGQKIRIPKNL